MSQHDQNNTIPPRPSARPFADAVQAYALAGWPCVLPVPSETKSPPPVGFTGADGRDTEPLQLAHWLTSHGSWSVAWRMPDGVIGIDVDAYEKATNGGEQDQERRRHVGPLYVLDRTSGLTTSLGYSVRHLRGAFLGT